MLDGNIPMDIGLLKELATLNFSHNHLPGDIPMSVGNMSCLYSLDLSFNRLSGHIPQSLTSFDSLGVLNLSYNMLSGRIPRGDHFDTLSDNGWPFFGNDLLCGEPTKKLCDGDTSHTKEGEEEDDQEDAIGRIMFYGVTALGFGVGSWGLFFVLIVKKEDWWFPYWRFMDSVAVKKKFGQYNKEYI
ncbi:receptor-like protein 9DC3 [Papaver somniferum]|uniref:receptor-like protein 9DC3 n=1 Tax=Papaver somniferum TaxID=3469 RepID=UPI000E6FEAC3|nr:receptor-like protein 9DC3 [Papaver somniferum]